jgi:uncharacterized membrane protein (Fun14 family)
MLLNKKDKMKTFIKILIFIGVVFLIVLSVQLVWFYKYGGNLIVWLANGSQINETVIMEVSIDGKSIGVYNLDNSFIVSYSLPLRESLGKKIITIALNDGEVFLEKEIFLFSLRWVIIKAIDKETYFDDSEEQLLIYIENQFQPPIIM